MALVRTKDGVKLRRLTFISLFVALVALLPAVSGAALRPSFVHDIKVFHKVGGERSRPQPAQISLLVGGTGIGKMVRGTRGGRHFIIADVRGAEVALTRPTGPSGRISLDVGPTCRANATGPYFLRASVVIDGKARKAFVQGDCRWVVQVLAQDTRALTNTTFIFEN